MFVFLMTTLIDKIMPCQW